MGFDIANNNNNQIGATSPLSLFLFAILWSAIKLRAFVLPFPIDIHGTYSNSLAEFIVLNVIL